MVPFILAFVFWLACLAFNIWGMHLARKYNKKVWMSINLLFGLWSVYNLARLIVFVVHLKF